MTHRTRALLAASSLCLIGCPVEEPPAEEPDAPIEPYDPLPLVDPMIGTGGVGGEVIGLNPGASVPWGLTQAGPDTRHSTSGAPAFYHFGGYHHRDDQIVAFSHEHADGMGTNDFGNIAVMPRDGWDDAYVNGADRAVAFSHEREEAHPGSYRVTLDGDGTDVAIAATPRGAIHRYTFADGADPVVILDLGHELGSVEIDGATVAVDLDAGTVDAWQLLQGAYSGRYGGMQTWARLSFEPAPVASGTWADDGAPVAGSTSAEGTRAGAWVTFPEGTEEVVLRVALSHVDADGARANHAAELEGRSFDDVLAAAESAWRDVLGAVRVRGGTADERVIFHTALYHASLWPNLFLDVDGRYRGFDQAIHSADFPYRSNFSMWDTFRTLHPWMTLTRPDDARDFARSLVRMAEDGGTMPRWAHGHGYTGGMVGTPASQILAGTWLKGVDGWDAEAGYQACYRASTAPSPVASRGGIEQYLALHWVPVEAAGGSASLAVEYSWNDHALSLWGDALGHADSAAELREMSTWWANHWDPDQGFVVGRHADGAFVPLASAEAWDDVYVEGNAWHYLWPAPQDVAAMIEVEHGGDTGAFLARLRGFWAAVEAEPDDAFPDDYYWHGNEPDLHYAWLGSLAGSLRDTVGPVRHVMATRYDTSDAGLDGNDDAGTLSAWYLFAALGFYPVAGTTTYALGSPIFDRVELDRPEGTLVIRAPGAGPEPVVPSSITIGDVELGSTIEHDQLVGGGELVFTLGEGG
jgi:predicted alpha-1,2-mannosidase